MLKMHRATNRTTGGEEEAIYSFIKTTHQPTPQAYLERQRRHNHVTPKSYLELIGFYKASGRVFRLSLTLDWAGRLSGVGFVVHSYPPNPPVTLTPPHIPSHHINRHTPHHSTC